MKFIFGLILAIFALIAFTGASRPKHCDLPPESGTCQQFLKVYHFDPKSNSCKTFEYGGCGGNGNRFDTQSLCEKECKK
ncbi:kunitz-type serine protease inhibitor 2-like [Condylostylus longicornis]|uniref:kunitz-type serine protease inhibitor 2-like n=1 Tax=Condylostylus longicornis TaxID=2530218 RepID=UPI00244E0864|nr:kunitz-type serine protease inhibitor 2-like [Condylostylus longicornis]